MSLRKSRIKREPKFARYCVTQSHTRSIRVAIREMIGREIPKQTVDDFLRERCDRGRSFVHIVSSGVRALL